MGFKITLFNYDGTSKDYGYQKTLYDAYALCADLNAIEGICCEHYEEVKEEYYLKGKAWCGCFYIEKV